MGTLLFIANDPVVVVFMIAGFLTFGKLMGVAVWLVAAMTGRSVAPTLPSPNDRFVRQPAEVWLARSGRNDADGWPDRPPSCSGDAQADAAARATAATASATG